LTNEIPHLTDASGALTDRFIVVQLRRSFLDQEDIKLSEKLLAELPGILNWAIAGYLRLRCRGRFLQPLSGRETIEVMCAMTSPIKAFVEEKCRIGPRLSVPKDELFSAWKRECDKNNVNPGTRELFGRDLRAAFPEIGESQPSMGHKRVRMYTGIASGSSALGPSIEKVVQLRTGEEKL
jgi:putative DNA primase/helicase